MCQYKGRILSLKHAPYFGRLLTRPYSGVGCPGSEPKFSNCPRGESCKYEDDISQLMIGTCLRCYTVGVGIRGGATCDKLMLKHKTHVVRTSLVHSSATDAWSRRPAVWEKGFLYGCVEEARGRGRRLNEHSIMS